jgi:hypothetical protein
MVVELVNLYKINNNENINKKSDNKFEVNAARLSFGVENYGNNSSPFKADNVREYDDAKDEENIYGNNEDTSNQEIINTKVISHAETKMKSNMPGAWNLIIQQ